MQTSADNMSVMAEELCRALGIDVPSLFNLVQDDDSNLPSTHTMSPILSEDDMGGDDTYE